MLEIVDVSGSNEGLLLKGGSDFTESSHHMVDSCSGISGCEAARNLNILKVYTMQYPLRISNFHIKYISLFQGNLGWWRTRKSLTLPKTNMEPGNGPAGKWESFWKPSFSGSSRLCSGV